MIVLPRPPIVVRSPGGLAPDDQSSRSPLLWPLLVPLAVLCAVVAMGPLVYSGGGADDWWYLEAARCWAANGGCLADNHWAARLPIVAPVGLALHWGGERLPVLALVPALYSTAAVALLAGLTARRASPRAGLVAGVALAMTPAFFQSTLQLSVDHAELAWALGAAALLLRARDTSSVGAALLGGLCLGLACLTRLTAVTLLPLAVLALWPRDRAGWRVALGAAAGCAGPLLAEAAGYWIATGDPVHHLRLALAHTTIPSSALDPSVDLRQSALFNPAYIGGWTDRMGIRVHWSVDGFLNLVAGPQLGSTWIAAAALALAAGLPFRAAGSQHFSGAGALVLAAIVHFALLVYALAVDPSPRMMMVELAVACVVLGLAADRLLASGRAGLVLLLAALGLPPAVRYATVPPEFLSLAPIVAARAAAHGPVALDDWTHRAFALAPALARLPVGTEAGADRLLILWSGCAAQRPAGWRLAAREPMPQDRDRLSDWLRAAGVRVAPPEPLDLCLFSRS